MNKKNVYLDAVIVKAQRYRNSDTVLMENRDSVVLVAKKLSASKRIILKNVMRKSGSNFGSIIITPLKNYVACPDTAISRSKGLNVFGYKEHRNFLKNLTISST